MGVVSYIGLGSNLGNREANIKKALELLHHPPAAVVKRVAPFYRTAPVGFTGQAEFLNTVAEVDTTIQPAELLRLLLSIEVELGRERTVRWGPRTIDLDLLLYGCLQINEPDLIVPHPRLHERAFVLVPLADLAPALVLPGRGKVAVLAVRLAEEQEIKRP
ncbi:MAG: 2-amino-4-hydroxy-6-hydroxymethyldihydropteridine diphosphokinase [Firmicutes bacterium]|nr:2-amino-4-hydroxy-6-hydroxymethyldihydropteridine diphosphokinase [Bacillota bacterium]